MGSVFVDTNKIIRSPLAKSFWANTANLPAPADPFQCLGVSPTADQVTVQAAWEKLTPSRERARFTGLSPGRLDYIRREVNEAYTKFSPNTTILSQPPAATFWWHDPTRIAPSDPYDILGLERNVDMEHVHLAATKLLVNWDWEGVSDPAMKLRACYVYSKIEEAYEILKMISKDQEAALGLKKLPEAYPDTLPQGTETTSNAPLAEEAKPDQPSKMFIHYTISEDRSGDKDSVASARLAALGSRSRESRFSNASLAFLGRQGGVGLVWK